MARIELADAQAWAEPFKLPLTSLESGLEDSISTQVLAKLAIAFDTSPWTTFSTTPELVRKIIAMMYVSSMIQRAISSEENLSEYALWLWATAQDLIDGLVAGTLVLDPEVPPTGTDTTLPLYYPTDASSAQEATSDDMSLGKEKFTMGTIW